MYHHHPQVPVHAVPGDSLPLAVPRAGLAAQQVHLHGAGAIFGSTCVCCCTGGLICDRRGGTAAFLYFYSLPMSHLDSRRLDLLSRYSHLRINFLLIVSALSLCPLAHSHSADRARAAGRAHVRAPRR